MSTAPTYTGTAHGEISNGWTWNEHDKQWVNIVHLVTSDKAVIEKEVNDALQEVGVTNEVIDKLFERAATVDFHIEDGDLEAYNKADKVRKEIQKIRRIGENNMELIHGRYVALWKASGEVKKKTEARLKEPEEIVLKHLNSYKRREEEKLEAERERERMLMEQRNKDLMDLGFTVINGAWVMTTLSVPCEGIMQMDHEAWKNLYASMRMHSEDVQRKAEEEAKAKAELERQAEEARKLIAQAQAIKEEARRSELQSIGALESEFPALPLNQYDDAQWMQEKNSTLGRVQLRQANEAHRARLAKADQRQRTLMSLGFTVEDNGDDQWLELRANNIKLATLMFDGEHGLTNISDEAFEELVVLGNNEMLRRKEVEELRIRHEERQRMEAEKARQEQAEREAQARAILEQGDKEVLRQINVIITNAGKNVRELLPSVKAEANIATVEQVLKMLASCYEATK